MEQLSEPAVLLARHTYFPDMLLVRLLSLRVPCLSSAGKEQPLGYVHSANGIFTGSVQVVSVELDGGSYAGVDVRV